MSILHWVVKYKEIYQIKIWFKLKIKHINWSAGVDNCHNLDVSRYSLLSPITTAKLSRSPTLC